MNKKYLYVGISVLLIIVAIFFNQFSKSKEIVENNKNDYKNIAYVIDNQIILLKDGFAETNIVPDSASKTTIRYFGNELIADINGDNRDDAVFLLTMQTGGSGIFYYVVGALKTEDGYVGSDGYYLGDRIAPQNIEKSQDSRHKDVIVINYADRAVGEPMTREPSLGKSVYLKIDNETNHWAIVANNFGD